MHRHLTHDSQSALYEQLFHHLHRMNDLRNRSNTLKQISVNDNILRYEQFYSLINVANNCYKNTKNILLKNT